MVEDRSCDNCAYHCYSEEYCKTERECKRAFGDNWEDGRGSVKVEVKDNNYENTGTLVKNSRSGKIGVVLLEFPTGQVQVLESIEPFVICTHDSWDTLENCEEPAKKATGESLPGCDTCKHEEAAIDEFPCCECWNIKDGKWEGWEPKEKKEELGERCKTCEYASLDSHELPCADCKLPDGNDGWEPKEKGQVDHPEHYNFSKHECIEEMVHLFGKEAVLHWCMCNVYKYRYRTTHKNGEEDLKKADWYMDKTIELQDGSDSFGR